MEEIKENSPEEQGYTPRPAWQVWCARLGLVLMAAFIVYQLLTIAGGGLG